MLKLSKLIFVSILSFMLVVVGCSNTESPTQAAQDQQSNIPADVQQQMQLAKQYHKLIDAMDPYVTEAPNGEFAFDEAGFTSQYGALPESDQQLVQQLKDGIPIANQKMAELSDTQPAAKIWFQMYWWGYKECYSEYSAEWMLDLMSRTGYAYGAWYWASRYNYTYGYFCIGHTWAGGLWITL